MLNKQQLKHLRTLAHERKPIIWVGQHGLGDNVLEEIELALVHHELVKIKLRAGDRGEHEKICQDLRVKSGAELVQKIGNTLTLYRRNADNPLITLP